MKKYNEIVRMEHTCAAYGTFDSVHRGHIKLAKELAEQGRKRGLTSVLVILNGEDKVLTTETEKEYFLEDTGIDVLMFSPERTVEIESLIETLGAEALVIGENHKELSQVKKAAEKAGAEVVICEGEKEDGELITTELVKEAFEACDFRRVEALCGHPYIMTGKVMHGKALGRTVGMPTANLGAADNKLMPPDGVYATSVTIDGEHYKAMTNIGKRPSVDNFDYVTIEAFILDFSRDIYGKDLLLEVYRYVRGVKKFDCLEDVQKQVQKDIQAVRDVLDAKIEAAG